MGSRSSTVAAATAATESANGEFEIIVVQSIKNRYAVKNCRVAQPIKNRDVVKNCCVAKEIKKVENDYHIYEEVMWEYEFAGTLV